MATRIEWNAEEDTYRIFIGKEEIEYDFSLEQLEELSEAIGQIFEDEE